MSNIFWLLLVIKIILVLLLAMGPVPFLVWFERRGSAWMQGRVGPNRVGPFGLLQSLADVLKFFFKEDFFPQRANKFFYYCAPAIALMAPLGALSLIPFAGPLLVDGEIIPMQVANLDAGLLFILAFAGLEVYPIILAGWSSNNKYSLLGALRGASQIISYEIAMALALASMLLAYGTLTPGQIVGAQMNSGVLGYWGVFINPVGAFIFWVCTFAETNRLPFDLPEGEAELVAGFHLEYGSIKFALFFLAEYVAMIMASALLVTIFFGGYDAFPGLDALFGLVINALPEVLLSWLQSYDLLAQLPLLLAQLTSMVLKVGFFMFMFVWVRWTIPRFRYDQLMDLGWKILFPLALLNLAYMALMVAWTS